MQRENRWILYSGYVDQDSQVTSTDYVRWYNAQHVESFGYESADIEWMELIHRIKRSLLKTPEKEIRQIVIFICLDKIN
jgi:hypothetical protein